MFFPKQVFAGFLFCFIAGGAALAQESPVEAYINQYAAIAIKEQVRTGVPAAITLAQGVHESGMGRGRLAVSSNNHFGIKCKSDWVGGVVFHNDDARGECFRYYVCVEDSYRDHSDFLVQRPHYASLFSLAVEDYKGWAIGLKKAGYATNPRYSQLLIELIEKFNLNRFTQQATEIARSSMAAAQ